MSEEIENKTEQPKELSLEAQVEALLFVSPTAVTLGQLATALETTVRQVEKALDAMRENYLARGIRIQNHRGKVQLTSAPESAPLIERFLSLEATSRLSQAALESLAIIAYQQPVTRPLVDSIRGVNSDSVIRNLLSKGLIEEAGRSEGPGRPILYSTSPEFLQHFGLSSLKDLPPLQMPETPKLPGADGAAEQQELPLGVSILKG